MDKGEEGKRDSLWKEGITAQSSPLIISGERYFHGVANGPWLEAAICIKRLVLSAATPQSHSRRRLFRGVFKTNG